MVFPARGPDNVAPVTAVPSGNRILELESESLLSELSELHEFPMKTINNVPIEVKMNFHNI